MPELTPERRAFSPARSTMPFAASTCVTSAPDLAHATEAPPVYAKRFKTFTFSSGRADMRAAMSERMASQLTACSGNSPVCLKPMGFILNVRSA